MWICQIRLFGESAEVTSLRDISEFLLTCLEISLLLQALWKEVFSVVPYTLLSCEEEVTISN